jgi:hypothetical protein
VIEINLLLQRLCDAGVDFVIVGGFAATLHGSSLVTRDLDVCAILSSENVEKLRAALRDLQPTHRLTPQKLSFLDNPDPGVKVRNLYLRTDFGPVDILSSILGVGDFDRVRVASIEVELFGRGCRVKWDSAPRTATISGSAGTTAPKAPDLLRLRGDVQRPSAQGPEGIGSRTPTAAFCWRPASYPLRTLCNGQFTKVCDAG